MEHEVEPGPTPGKAEGNRDPDKQALAPAPGPTPTIAEGDRDTERVNLGEPEEG